MGSGQMEVEYRVGKNLARQGCANMKEGGVQHGSVQLGQLTIPSAYHHIPCGRVSFRSLLLNCGSWEHSHLQSAGIPSSVLPPASFYTVILIPCLTQVIF